MPHGTEEFKKYVYTYFAKTQTMPDGVMLTVYHTNKEDSNSDVVTDLRAVIAHSLAGLILTTLAEATPLLTSIVVEDDVALASYFTLAGCHVTPYTSGTN